MAAPAIPRAEPSALAQLVDLAAKSPPPKGRRSSLAGRGEIFVRTQRGPSDAPTVVLLHGWIASAGLNWFQVFDALRGRYRVIAPDLRGHARGIRSWRRFRLHDCADDVAALLRKRRERAIVVGYSMGGPVAQLLWKRHPDLVSGLVLAATSGRPLRNQGFGMAMTGVMEGAALAGRAVGIPGLFRKAVSISNDPTVRQLRAENLPLWARAEIRRHHVRHLLEAGAELGRFDATPWLSEIDVPTSVIVTESDSAIPPDHQRALAKAIRGARMHRLPGGHLSFAKPAFGSAIRAAVDSVAQRASDDA